MILDRTKGALENAAEVSGVVSFRGRLARRWMCPIRRRSLIVLTMVVVISACAHAPRGRLAAECSGIPGDFRTPGSQTDRKSLRVSSVDPVPEKREAIAKPATSRIIPPLYIFDDKSSYVHSFTSSSRIIDDPVFLAAEREAYWGELVDDRVYFIPWLDKCSQASMVHQGLEFRAPESGLLFVQFVTPGCSRCELVSSAIRRAIVDHPDVPFHWVEITVPSRVGRVIDM